MSINIINSRIKRLSNEETSLNKKLSKEYVLEASKLKEIRRIEKSIAKNTSPALLRSKRAQIDRCNNTIMTSKKKQGDLTKKIGDVRFKLSKEQGNLSKEQMRINALQAESTLKHEQSIAAFQSTITAASSKSSSPPKKYDFFISHAFEDKDFADPLKIALEAHGAR